MGFLFFKKKKKKNEEINPEVQDQENVDENVKPQNKQDDDSLDEVELTPKQKAKKEKLKSLEGKISKILQSNNIEIVDENAGDEYDLEEDESASEKQKQQDYEALKDLFGKDSKKKQEVTLTIDDFDYTYVGKYVEDYDLIHMKNIKKIKLTNKHKKLIQRLVIAAVAVILLSIGGVVAYKMTRAEPVYLKSVYLSQTSQSYFIDETFDYTGIYILAEYSNGFVDKIKLTGAYLYSTLGYVEGFGGNIKFTGGDVATLFFQYNGFRNIKFTVNVKVKSENGLTAKYTNGLFNLKQNEYINDDYLINLIEYSNYNAQKLSYHDSNLSIEVDGKKFDEYDKDHNGFRVENDITQDSEIIVKYKGYSITLKYGEYSASTLAPVQETPVTP